MFRCSPEAFAKCPTRHICGNIQEATFMEGSECDQFNQSVADRPMTNADRMVAMIQNGEVAELLNWWEEIFGDGVPGEDYMRWWLQRPAKEDV